MRLRATVIGLYTLSYIVAMRVLLLLLLLLLLSLLQVIPVKVNCNYFTLYIPCEQRLHFCCVSWRTKSSFCLQPFKSVHKSGRIN